MLFLTDLFRVNFSVSIWRKTNRHLRLDFAQCLCDRNVLRIDQRNLQLSSRAQFAVLAMLREGEESLTSRLASGVSVCRQLG